MKLVILSTYTNKLLKFAFVNNKQGLYCENSNNRVGLCAVTDSNYPVNLIREIIISSVIFSTVYSDK